VLHVNPYSVFVNNKKVHFATTTVTRILYVPVHAFNAIVREQSAHNTV
jgi:hypothetical protein